MNDISFVRHEFSEIYIHVRLKA